MRKFWKRSYQLTAEDMMEIVEDVLPDLNIEFSDESIIELAQMILED